MKAVVTLYFEGSLVGKQLSIEELEKHVGITTLTSSTSNDDNIYKLDITINGNTTRIDRIKSKEVIEDVDVYKSITTIEIALVQISKNWLNKSEEKVIEVIKYSVRRMLNNKITITFRDAKHFGIPELIGHTGLECTTSGFEIREIDPIIGESILNWLNITDPIYLSIYFNDFNSIKVKEALSNNEKYVIQIKIVSITSPFISNNVSVSRVYFKTILEKTEKFINSNEDSSEDEDANVNGDDGDGKEKEKKDGNRDDVERGGGSTENLIIFN